MAFPQAALLLNWVMGLVWHLQFYGKSSGPWYSILVRNIKGQKTKVYGGFQSQNNKSETLYNNNNNMNYFISINGCQALFWAP